MGCEKTIVQSKTKLGRTKREMARGVYSDSGRRRRREEEKRREEGEGRMVMMEEVSEERREMGETGGGPEEEKEEREDRGWREGVAAGVAVVCSVWWWVPGADSVLAAGLWVGLAAGTAWQRDEATGDEAGRLLHCYLVTWAPLREYSSSPAQREKILSKLIKNHKTHQHWATGRFAARRQ